MLLSFYFHNSFSQGNTNFDLTLKKESENPLINLNLKHQNEFESIIFQKLQVLNTTSSILLLAWPLNPMIVYENEKVNFGLTKEVSAVFPFIRTKNFGAIGRMGFEYSYIFRAENKNHLRGFLNIDLPIHSGDFIAFTTGIGGGYFTDTRKSGIFPQISLNMFVPFGEGLGITPYFKLRHTFMFNETKSDVTDLSLGIGLIILPFFK